MSSVYFSGPNNSTTFTTCCGSAIGGEKCCPSCGKEVDGYVENSDNETCKKRFYIAYKPYQLTNVKVSKNLKEV